MAAHRSTLCAVGRASFVLMWIAWVFCGRGTGQQLLPVATEQPRAAIAALAERLSIQLLAAGKKKPYILDLSLPDGQSCPLGAWLADRLSESLANAHPELGLIARDRWSSTPSPAQFAHDRNQEYAQNEQRALLLGAEVLVQGNFAAIPEGIGITLIASDRLVGGKSRLEALAEVPITSEMQAVLTSSLPHRPERHGMFQASMAGIGGALCEVCPAPEYTYVAKTKKLEGVVIAEVWVGTGGAVENVRVVRNPNPALASAALRAVRNWRFKPASNARGEFVPVIVDLAVTFRLDLAQAAKATGIANSTNSPKSSTETAATIKKF